MSLFFFQPCKSEVFGKSIRDLNNNKLNETESKNSAIERKDSTIRFSINYPKQGKIKK